MTRIIEIKASELCKCDPLPHLNHQRCNGCGSKVPVPVEITAFTNSISHCGKCPEERKQMFEPIEVRVKWDE